MRELTGTGLVVAPATRRQRAARGQGGAVCALKAEGDACGPATHPASQWFLCDTHAELLGVTVRLAQTGALMPKRAPRGPQAVVTRGVPTTRSGQAQANAAKTHCPQGHPYSATNTGRATDGGRYCKACKKARTAARKERAA